MKLRKIVSLLVLSSTGISIDALASHLSDDTADIVGLTQNPGDAVTASERTPASAKTTPDVPVTRRLPADLAQRFIEQSEKYKSQSEAAKTDAQKQALRRLAEVNERVAGVVKDPKIQADAMFQKLANESAVFLIGENDLSPTKDTSMVISAKLSSGDENVEVEKSAYTALKSLGGMTNENLTGRNLAALYVSSKYTDKIEAPKDDAPVKTNTQSLTKTRDELLSSEADPGVRAPSSADVSSARRPVDTVSPEDRAQFVASHVASARSELGIQHSDRIDVSSSPLYSSAPVEIRDWSQGLFNNLVRNQAASLPPSADLKPLSDLLGNENFQSFAERTLGSSRLRAVNLDVAAAVVGSDTKNGAYILAGVSKGVALAKGSAAPNTPSPLLAKSALSSSPGISGEPNKAIAATPEEWIETARLLSRSEGRERLLALERDPARYNKSLVRLESWIRELRSLKADSGLSAVTYPFAAPDAEQLKQARWNFERAMRDLSKGPGDKKFGKKDAQIESEWVHLMTHAQAQVHRLMLSKTTDRDLEVIRLTFADRVISDEWRSLAKGNYQAARTAAGQLVLLAGLTELADAKSALHYVAAAAFADIDRRREAAIPPLAKSIPSNTRKPTSASAQAPLNFDDVD